ncbi:hypothetical protein [Paracoccus beibuensis]|nr:hypothetical protein [Paracoccus beibuensis]
MALLDVALAADDVVFVDSTSSPSGNDLISLGALNADTTVFSVTAQST